MSSDQPPTEYFNGISYNPNFFQSTTGITQSFADQRYLQRTGAEPNSSAITTLFTGNIIASGLQNSGVLTFPDTSTDVPTCNYVDTYYSSLSGSNAFTGTNTFNTNLPSSTIAPTTQYQLVNKTYADSISGSSILSSSNNWLLQQNFNDSASVTGSLYFGSSTGFNEIHYNSTNNGIDINSYLKGQLLMTSTPQLVWTNTGVNCPNSLTSNDIFNTYSFSTNINDMRVATTAYLTSYYQPLSNMSLYPTNAGNNTFTGSNTFNNASTAFVGTVYLDALKIDSCLFDLYNNMNIYGSQTVNLFAGGITGWSSYTCSLSLDPTINLCSLSTPIVISGTTTATNSIITPYLTTYNNTNPALPTTYSLNTNFNGTTFSKTVPNPAALTATSTTLYTQFTLPANYNKTMTISMPVSVGVSATGAFVATSAATISITQTISVCQFIIYKNGLLFQAINATNNAYNILSNTVTLTIASALSGSFVYQYFLGNFNATFTPSLQDTTAYYTILFKSTNTTTTSTTGTFTSYSGIPNVKYNSNNFTSSSALTNCTINYGTVGLNGLAMTLIPIESVVTTSGTAYVNQLNITYNSPILNTDNIGYSVPTTLTTGLNIPTGTFKIVAQTTSAIPNAGFYTCFWTNFLAVTGSSAITNAFIMGVLCSNTIPTYFGGNDYIEIFNNSFYTGQNNGYTSSTFFDVPTSGTHNVYMFIYTDFPAGVVLTTSGVSKLKVIRTC